MELMQTQTREQKKHVETLKGFVADLRVKKSNPQYDRASCEAMISAVEAALEALEVQAYA